MLENLEVLEALLHEIAIYEMTQWTTNESPSKQEFGETQSSVNGKRFCSEKDI